MFHAEPAMPQTPQEVLNVAPNANLKEISAAYLTQAYECYASQDASSRKKYQTLKDAYHQLLAVHKPSRSSSSSSTAPMLSRAQINKDFFADRSLLFMTYAQLITNAMFNEQIAPEVILKNLLEYYLQAKNSFFTLYGRTRSHLDLAQRLVNFIDEKLNLSQQIDVMHSGNELLLSCVFKLCEAPSLVFNPQGEFIELFNAFFSFYPGYLNDLSDSDFKQKIHVNLSIPLFIKNQLQNSIANWVNKPTFLLSRDEVVLLKITDLTERYCEHGIHLTDSDQIDYFIKNLRHLTENLSETYLQDTLFPFINKTLASDYNPERAKNCFDIINQIIRRVDINFLKEKLLPVLLLAKHQFNEFHLPQTLAEIALRLYPSEFNNLILPSLKNFLAYTNYHVKANTYAAINKLPTLMIASLIPMLIPHILNDLHESITQSEIFLLFLSIKHINDRMPVSLSSSSLYLAHAVNAISTEIMKLYNRKLQDLRSDVPKIKNAAMNDLSTIIMVLDEQIINADIMPLIITNLTRQSAHSISAAYFFLEKVAELPSISIEHKQYIFSLLAEQMQQGINLGVLNVIKKYVAYHEDVQDVKDIQNRLIDMIKYQEPTANAANTMMIELLTEIVKRFSHPTIESYTLFLMQELLSIPEEQLTEESLNLLNICLEKCSKAFIKEFILWEMMTDINPWPTKIMRVMSQHTHTLNYGETIYFAIKMLLTGVASPDKLSTELLGQLYRHQESLVEIHRIKKMDATVDVPALAI